MLIGSCWRINGLTPCHFRLCCSKKRLNALHCRSLCATFLITETNRALTKRARDYGLFNTICYARHKLRGISHKLLPIWLRLSRGHWLTFGSRRHARVRSIKNGRFQL